MNDRQQGTKLGLVYSDHEENELWEEKQFQKQCENMKENGRTRKIQIKMMKTKFIQSINLQKNSVGFMKESRNVGSPVNQKNNINEELKKNLMEENMGRYQQKNNKKAHTCNSSRLSRYNDTFRMAKFGQTPYRSCTNEKIILKKGIVFSGNIEMGQCNSGKLTFLDGSIYTGGLKKFRFDGYGRLKMQDGKIIQGEWKDGVIEKNATIVYNNKDIYRGDVHNLKKHGQGKLELHNGNRYEGEFCDGQITGYGKYYDKQKLIAEGYWKNGQFLGKYKGQTGQETEEFLA